MLIEQSHPQKTDQYPIVALSDPRLEFCVDGEGAHPGDLCGLLVLSDEELASELINMTDAFIDELFTFEGASRVVFPVSRLIVDPERFQDDPEEPLPRWVWGGDLHQDFGRGAAEG